MKRKNFSVIELMVVIVVIMILIALVGPMIQKLLINAKRAQSFNNLKNLVIAMQDYASSDTKKSRMPYPIQKGSATMFAWGADSGCWSPEIVKLLFKSHNLAKGNEGILVSTGVTGGEYEPMFLSEDTAAGGNANKMRWEEDSELHYHVFCGKSLTNAASGNMVMGISYDQPDINNCLFSGQGWIVFFMDGSGGWKKRKQFGSYDFEHTTDKLVNTIGGGAGLTAVKVFDSAAALRTIFGSNGNGGSTEVIGSKSTSAFFRGFVEE
ncbi:MAG: hypothetical protein COA79_05145 [Planctomycetota bacterium]|nr:MAG: hypothetical protein COA79_05145 [Planctomycetota bacterium]